MAQGLNCSRKKRKDGTVVEYFYDRASGNFLGHNRAEALKKLERQIPDTKVRPGSIAQLVAEYRGSVHYRTRLAPKTRKLYGSYLDLILSEWGDLPVKGLKPGHIERIKSIFERTPRKANTIIQVLRVILGRAVKWDWIESNPASRPGMIPMKPRTTVWSPENEALFLDAAPPSLKLAFGLMLYTVQRPSDVLAMTRGQVSEVNGRLWISLRQQKTGELVAIPIHSRLEPYLLARLEQPGLLLIPSPTGIHWAFRNFCRKWDLFMKELELSGLQRRDLRRTGIVRMAEAGATTPQIASVSGHGIDYCQSIIDVYLPRRSEVALGAMVAWESAGQAPSKVVTFRR